jgi:hypothetical protein
MIGGKMGRSKHLPLSSISGADVNGDRFGRKFCRFGRDFGKARTVPFRLIHD